MLLQRVQNHEVLLGPPTPVRTTRKPMLKKPPVNQFFTDKAKRELRRDTVRPNEERDTIFRRMILSIPPGKVSTYGKVAAAAGYPLYHRAVARLLRTDLADQLPWHRILGAGGLIKLRGVGASEQRARLELEGVQFDGTRIDMERFEHFIKPWNVYR
jgi:methylated-DNA-protein-cysteine methyltransferase-like protein